MGKRKAAPRTACGARRLDTPEKKIRLFFFFFGLATTTRAMVLGTAGSWWI